jgi:hypothetical protein
MVSQAFKALLAADRNCFNRLVTENGFALVENVPIYETEREDEPSEVVELLIRSKELDRLAGQFLREKIYSMEGGWFLDPDLGFANPVADIFRRWITMHILQTNSPADIHLEAISLHVDPFLKLNPFKMRSAEEMLPALFKCLLHLRKEEKLLQMCLEDPDVMLFSG